MADRTTRVTALTTAWTNGGDAVAALAPLLAPDAVAVSPTGEGEGRDAAAAVIGTGRLAALLAGATWAEPTADGDVVTLRGTAAPGAPIAGTELRFTFGPDDQVTRIEQTITMAPPPEERPVDLTELAPLIDNALAEGKTMLLAYVDREGQPSISLRGSVQVRTPDQLQVWIRNPDGGLLNALPHNDRVTLWYRGERGATLHIKGRASVLADPADRQAVWDSTPEPERRADREQKGLAIAVDVESVGGRGPGGGIRMSRGG